MNTKRIERLLKLIQLLEGRCSSTVDELSEVVGVSRRTIFRDLKLLERSGITYHFDRASKQYSAARTTLLPPVTLTHAEAMSILIATRVMMNHPASIDSSISTSAALKMESMLPAPLMDYCGPLLDRMEFRFSPSSDYQTIQDMLPTLHSALLEKKKIRIRYDSYYDKEKIDVDLHPYRLSYIHRGWYIIAFSEPHKEVRTFKVERILQLKILEEAYTIDPEFNLEKYFDHAWLMIKGDQRYHIKVRFLPKVASNVDEINWHKTQRTIYEPDGSMLFEVDVDGLFEIAWWILGYGDQAQVLEPIELREIIATHVKQMYSYYKKDLAKNS